MSVAKEHEYHHSKPFNLELGGSISGLRLKYFTWGELNEDKSNVIWVFHALTANANVEAWWPEMVGEDYLFKPSEHFIICVNLLGSCYGSTGPLDINPATKEKYYGDFPKITMRDIVNSCRLVKDDLGISSALMGAGASMGACLGLEWSIMEPDFFKELLIVGCSAKESAWGKAIHTAHRMALEADETWGERRDDAGAKGLAASRAFGMVVYRSFECFNHFQKDEEDILGEYKAESYQRYQGQKLVDRFNAYSYDALLKALDTHNVGRGRGSIVKALAQIKAKAILIGIDSDILYPTQEQFFLHEHIPDSYYESIGSLYGHDGFLIETKEIKEVYYRSLNKNENQ